MRGKWVVLEGLDGAGTTTQAKRLVQRLQADGHRAVFTAEPSSLPTGKLIRQQLRGEAPADRHALALLFAADRLEHVAREIEPSLASGVHVVCDRYVLSSLAYQALDAKVAWIEAINARAPRPDLTLFLRVRPRVALSRRVADSAKPELFETLPQLTKVARHYEAALRKKGRAQRAVVLDGEAPLAEVSAAVFARVAALLAKRGANG